MPFFTNERSFTMTSLTPLQFQSGVIQRNNRLRFGSVCPAITKRMTYPMPNDVQSFRIKLAELLGADESITELTSEEKKRVERPRWNKFFHFMDYLKGFPPDLRRNGNVRRFLEAAGVQDIMSEIIGGKNSIVIQCSGTPSKTLKKALSTLRSNWDTVPIYINLTA